MLSHSLATLLLASLPCFASALTVGEQRAAIDEYFFQVSMGNAGAIVDLFADEFKVLYPALPVADFPGGTIDNKAELSAFYTKLSAMVSPRKARATDIIIDGLKASTPMHLEGTNTVSGAFVSHDDVNTWTFSPDGKFKSMRVYSGGGFPLEPEPRIAHVALPDPKRGGKLVNASVCVPPGTDKAPLLIFSHGWRVAAEDYDYLCRQLSTAKKPWVVALIETPLENPAVQPPLLDPLAMDAAFLSHKMLSAQFEAFSGRLNGKVVLGGHSMGGGTSVLAAAMGAKADAMVLWAPGLYGNPSVNATVSAQVTSPTLIMLGSADCVNVGNVALRGVDTYEKLGSTKKALVVLKDVNHCFWSTPVKGACAYDICTSVPRLQQQAVGLKLMQSFAAAALDGSTPKWSGFMNQLSAGIDSETGVQWQYAATSTGEKSVRNITYEFCPSACCSEALAKMGLCKKGMDSSVQTI